MKCLTAFHSACSLFAFPVYCEIYFSSSCRNKGLFAKEMGCILTDIYYNKLDSPIFLTRRTDAFSDQAPWACVQKENQT